MNNLLPQKILEEIKERQLVPRPEWQFVLKNWLLWLFVCVASILGGVAFALAVFLFLDHDAYARAQLDESLFVELFEIIPYIWLSMLVALVGIAKYAVRHTTFGYRYSGARIIALVLSGSLAVGLILHVTEAGERIQDSIVRNAPFYGTIISISEDVWSQPEKGFLSGIVVAKASTDEFELKDMKGKLWLIDYEQLSASDIGHIRIGETLKIVGSLEDSTTFRAVKVILLVK